MDGAQPLFENSILSLRNFADHALLMPPSCMHYSCQTNPRRQHGPPLASGRLKSTSSMAPWTVRNSGQGPKLLYTNSYRSPLWSSNAKNSPTCLADVLYAFTLVVFSPCVREVGQISLEPVSILTNAMLCSLSPLVGITACFESFIGRMFKRRSVVSICRPTGVICQPLGSR